MLLPAAGLAADSHLISRQDTDTVHGGPCPAEPNMKYVLGGLASLALLLVVVAAFALAGGYNVAATEGHNGLTRWFLATVMRRSVASRATSVNAPTQFTSEQVAEGFSEFDEMCVTCHGAPGRDRGEVGKGLNPRPPKLAEAAKEWSTPQSYFGLSSMASK